VKFSCERCGKKYATAENPAPGRVYKLRCKACGHLIVVKAAPGGSTSAQPESPAGAVSTGTPIDPPSISFEVGAPEAAPASPPANGGGRRPGYGDGTTEVSMASARAGEVESGPPSDGYVDLFSDVGSGSEELPDRPVDDPFLAAARASLPDTYGSGVPGAPDPFVALREDLSAPRASPQPPPRPHPPVPKVPVIPKPRPQKSTVPIALIGGGVAVLVGILAFVILSAGKKERTAPERAAAGEPAPIPPPPLAPPAQEAPQTALPPAEPAPQAQRRESDEERRARAERLRRDREDAQARANEARAERDARDRAAREARDRDRADREARAREEREARAAREREARDAKDREAREARDAREREKAEREARAREERQRVAAATAAEEPEGGLTQAQIEAVLRSTKTAFDGCIQSARGTDVKLDGRRVMLRLNIQTSGTVTYPTLDDVTLNGTELGSCLKSAARLMVFPKFKGDTMHVEVPLVMR